MALVHDIDTLKLRLERQVQDLFEKHHEPVASEDFIAYAGPYEWTERFHHLPGAYLVKYYPEDLRRAVTNCLLVPALQLEDPQLTDFRFCLEFAAEAFRSHLYSEPMFTIMRKTAGTRGPLYRDHVLHVMNVYLLGDQLFREPSAVRSNRNGCHLLLERLRGSDPGKACEELLARELVSLPTDLSNLSQSDRQILSQDESLIRRAWRIAAYCHDIGYILSLTAQVKERQSSALTSGAERFRTSWPTLCAAFERGLEAFEKCAVTGSGHIDAVLGRLYDELLRAGRYTLCPVDHGQASAALLMNRFATEWSRIESTNTAALFLAICAIFRHTELVRDVNEDKYGDKADGIHKPAIWQEDPFSAFLALVDELQEFTARLCWYVDEPPEMLKDPVLVQIPVNAIMPIRGMVLDLDKDELRYYDCIEEAIGGWDPSDVPAEPKRRYLETALKKDCFGLVSDQFRIEPCGIA